MKKIVLVLFLFFFINQKAEAVESGWQDLDRTCFAKFYSINSPEVGTIKVKTLPEQVLFFVQNNDILPAKTFDYGAEQDINFEVINISGIEKQANVKYLTDGNLQTEIKFDPYNTIDKKEIKIDAGQLLLAGNFSFELYFKGDFVPRYFVSGGGTGFIEVKQVEDFDWRYLTIRFDNYLIDNNISRQLAVSEIGLKVRALDTLLVKSQNNSSINIYADYKCQGADLQKILINLNQKINQTKFSIDAQTKIYEVVLSASPSFNNDFDNDKIFNNDDNCPFKSNNNQMDVDGDLVGDACDFNNNEKNFFDQDSDFDGVGNSLDNCPYIYNPKQTDSNADKLGDACVDDDRDGFIGVKDNCPSVRNVDQKDLNQNSIGDVCEADKDKDMVFDEIDNCLEIANADQYDDDNDGVGNVCDNCRLKKNQDQNDVDKDKIGDKCDTQDNRFVESNQTIFMVFIVTAVIVFMVLIFLMIKKMKANEKKR